MNIYRHKSHTVYTLTKKILFYRQHKKMLFWYKGKIVKNHRFFIYPSKELKYFKWFIRLPFFYFERSNVATYIGTPDLYFRRERKKI